MRDSPYTPGAGHFPPVLAGRDLLESEWETMLSDVNGGGRKRARDIILRGPRGVGKTVLLSRFQEIAEGQGYDAISLQAATGGAGIVDGILARAEDRLRDQRPAWQRAKDTLQRLASLNATVVGTGGGISLTPQPEQKRPVDPGTLAATLAKLSNEIRKENPGGGLLITLDEMQVSNPSDLALLAAAQQRLNVEHPESAVAFGFSALPNIEDVLRDAGVTHPDRLLEIQPVPVELGESAARFAIREPAKRLGVAWSENGINLILATTRRYPAHLQLFADETWRLARGPSQITLDEAEQGAAAAQALVETRTLEPRWQRATDRHAELLTAIAAASQENPSGADYATTQQISDLLGRPVNEWSAARVELINEGDIYAPSRGRLAFTIPTYAPYVLANYEARRAEARIKLMSLPVMTERAAQHDSLA